MNNETTINQENYEIGLLDEVLQQIETKPTYLEIPAIAMYYYCYKIVNPKASESVFTQFQATVEQYQHLFPANELRDIYTFAINYAIRRLNTGSVIFTKVAFDFYRLSLEQGFLLEDGVMLESTYSNIVSLGLKLEQFDWVFTFLKQYQPFLKPTYQKALFHFNLAKYFYAKKLLKESLQELAVMDSKATFLFLGARILQLKIYYELKEIDPLESLLESIRIYLQRSKGLGYRKAHYENVLFFTRQLLQASTMTKQERKALKQSIQSAQVFAEKEWFLKQVGE